MRHNVQVHTGVKLLTVVWKSGGSKGRPEGHPARVSFGPLWNSNLGNGLLTTLNEYSKRAAHVDHSRGARSMHKHEIAALHACQLAARAHAVNKFRFDKMPT